MSLDLTELKKYSSIPPRGDKPFGEYLKELLTDFTTNQMIRYKKTVLKPEDFKLILDLCVRIQLVVDYGLKGLPYLAVYFFNDKRSISFATHSYQPGESFYRMRVVEDKRELE